MTDRQLFGAPKAWGRLSTFGLGFIAMLAGQMVALMVLNWRSTAGLNTCRFRR